jgi:hypothetical protein
LKNIDIKIKDENQAQILLRSLLDFFENFINSMLYNKDTISLPNVQVYFKLYGVNKNNEKKVVMIRLRAYLLSVVGKMHDIVVRTLMDVWCNTECVVYKDSNLC